MAEINLDTRCMILSLPTIYLGIPLGVNPRRKEAWVLILDRIKKKLNSWNLKLLSIAGRLTLIKVVLNNLPIYYLGLFKMPKQVMRKIISLQSRFSLGC